MQPVPTRGWPSRSYSPSRTMIESIRRAARLAGTRTHDRRWRHREAMVLLGEGATRHETDAHRLEEPWPDQESHVAAPDHPTARRHRQHARLPHPAGDRPPWNRHPARLRSAAPGNARRLFTPSSHRSGVMGAVTSAAPSMRILPDTAEDRDRSALMARLDDLVAAMQQLEREQRSAIEAVADCHRAGATSLIHYLAMRRHDLRPRCSRRSPKRAHPRGPRSPMPQWGTGPSA